MSGPNPPEVQVVTWRLLPFDLEFVLASLAADEGEAQEVEGLRLAKPTPLAAFRRKASRQRLQSIGAGFVAALPSAAKIGRGFGSRPRSIRTRRL
jgi:hypothetical protein